MPTIISHSAVPLAIGIGAGSNHVPKPLLVAGVIASMLPDADVLMFRLGATYDSAWAHRGFSHSLGFAMTLGLIAIFVFGRRIRPLVAFAFVAVSALSHGLLDMLTNGGHGIAILWPVTSQRYFFAFRPIQVSPLEARRFLSRAGLIAGSEIMWIWVPAIIVGLGLSAFRRHQGAAS